LDGGFRGVGQMCGREGQMSYVQFEAEHSAIKTFTITTTTTTRLVIDCFRGNASARRAAMLSPYLLR